MIKERENVLILTVTRSRENLYLGASGLFLETSRLLLAGAAEPSPSGSRSDPSRHRPCLVPFAKPSFNSLGVANRPAAPSPLSPFPGVDCKEGGRKVAVGGAGNRDPGSGLVGGRITAGQAGPPAPLQFGLCPCPSVAPSGWGWMAQKQPPTPNPPPAGGTEARRGCYGRGCGASARR